MPAALGTCLVPGLIVVTDVTPILNFGYFPSYNIPLSNEIFSVSGYPAMVAKYGPSFSYHGNAR